MSDPSLIPATAAARRLRDGSLSASALAEAILARIAARDRAGQIRACLDALGEDALQGIAQMHPVKRLGTPEEVSALTCFLLSKEASFITGSYHLVDGAYTAQ